MMRHFETLLLFSPELSSEVRDGIVNTLTTVITKVSGEVKDIDQWGMKTLAYPVQKQTRGFYIRLDYVAPGSVVAELERIIRITEGIFKFMTVRIEERKPRKALRLPPQKQESEHGVNDAAKTEESFLPSSDVQETLTTQEEV